jgi:tetratricopeptide (TPR) repeat protein
MLKIKVFENAQSFFERQVSADADLRIGRAPHCDLVLDSKRISREHGRIYHANGAWHIEDLKSQNGIRVNGKKITSEKLQHGDVIQIGDYRLEITMSSIALPPAAPSADDDRTVLLHTPPESDKTILGDRYSASGPAASEGLATRIAALPGKTKILGGALAVLVLLMLVVLLLPSSDQPSDPEATIVAAEQEKTETMMDAEARHQLNVYLQSGREQFTAGNYTEALVRFQAALNMDPENGEALEYMRRSREKMRELEEMRRMAAEAEQQRMTRVNAILARSRQAMHDAEYDRAMEMLAEAEFLSPGEASIQTLKTEIQTAITAEKARAAEDQSQQREKLSRLRQHFDTGQRYYDQGNYFDALQEWNQVLALNMETPESAHVRHAMIHLKKQMEDIVRKDYDKGKTFFRNKDHTQAMRHLQKVALVEPDYEDTKRMLAEASREVEAAARQLYQEGLVYEGIGQRDRAAGKWREILRVMPDENNTYYQRAEDKLK